MRRLLSARVPGGRESAAPLAAAASSPPGFAPAAFFKDGPLGPSSGVYGALECTDTTADSSFEGSFGASFARRVASAAVEGPASSFVEQRGIEGLFSVDSLADASSLKKNSVPAAAFAAMPPPTSTSTQLPGVAASAAAECLDFQSRGLLSAEATGALLSEGDATHVVDSLISRGWRPDTQELALRQQGLGDSACEIIASFLRRTPTVKRLDLSGNNISPVGLEALLPSLRGLSSLQEVTLDWNPLTSGDGGSRAFEVFLESLLALPVKRLSLQHCALHPHSAPALVSFCKAHKHLRQVSLAHNALGEEATGFLEAAKTNGSLAGVDVAGNGASPALLRRLSQICETNRQRLETPQQQPEEERGEQQQALENYVQKVEAELSRAEKDSNRRQRDKEKENQDLRERVRLLQHAVLRSSSDCEERNNLSEENALLKQSLEDRYEEICGLKLEIGELRSQQKFGQTQQRKFELVKEQLEARIQQRQQLYEELAEQHQETQAKLQEALSEMQMLQQLAETLKNRVEVQRRQMTQQTEQREQERLRLERLLAEEKSQGERQLQELQALHSQSNEHRQRLLDAQQELAAQRNQHRAHERRSQQELETARSEASSWKTKVEALEKESEARALETQRQQMQTEALRTQLASAEAELKKQLLQIQQQEAQLAAAASEAQRLREALSEREEGVSKVQRQLSEAQNELRQCQREVAVAKAKAEESKEAAQRQERLLQQRSDELLQEKRHADALLEKLKASREESLRSSEAAKRTAENMHRQKERHRSALRRISESIQNAFNSEMQTLEGEA